VAAVDRKRQKRNLSSLVRMRMNKKKRRRRRRIEASRDAIGEDETNTADLSFEEF